MSFLAPLAAVYRSTIPAKRAEWVSSPTDEEFGAAQATVAQADPVALAEVVDAVRADVRDIDPSVQVDDATVRFAIAVRLAHETLADASDAGPLSDAQLQRVASWYDDAILRVDPEEHERGMVDMGPFSDLFSSGPYVFRLSGSLLFIPLKIVDFFERLGPLRLLTMPVSLIISAFWMSFAYIDWLLWASFGFGYWLVDFVAGGRSTQELRRLERAFGSTLWGGGWAMRKQLGCGSFGAVQKHA